MLKQRCAGGILLICFQNSDKIRSIPVIQIEPSRSQPRVCFSKEALAGLSRSIRENGILQPISVRRVFASKFELVAGERRLRAAIMAGFKTVPCVILDCDETQAAVFALLENLQRANLNMFEEAEAMRNLIEIWGLTQESVAKKLGKKQSTIANKLRLLKLDDEERALIKKANLTERHARAILKLESKEQRKLMIKKIAAKNLNVQDTESLIDSILQGARMDNSDNIDEKFVVKDLTFFMNAINDALDLMKISREGVQYIHNESAEYLEYMIKIPKERGSKKVESA